jgi:hypothetical protein
MHGEDGFRKARGGWLPREAGKCTDGSASPVADRRGSGVGRATEAVGSEAFSACLQGRPVLCGEAVVVVGGGCGKGARAGGMQSQSQQDAGPEQLSGVHTPWPA